MAARVNLTVRSPPRFRLRQPCKVLNIRREPGNLVHLSASFFIRTSSILGSRRHTCLAVSIRRDIRHPFRLGLRHFLPRVLRKPDAVKYQHDGHGMLELKIFADDHHRQQCSEDRNHVDEQAFPIGANKPHALDVENLHQSRWEHNHVGGDRPAPRIGCDGAAGRSSRLQAGSR